MPFIELQSIDSTNNYARRMISEGLAQHNTAIFAHEQYAGRGQRDKTWLSEKDSSIILSILVQPTEIPIRHQFDLSLCAAISVLEFFSHYVPQGCSIKWPNDLYWQDRKAGGILIENIIRGTEEKLSPEWSIIGIGININQENFDDSLRNPVSLRQITGKSFQPIVLAKELYQVWEKNYQAICQEGPSGFHKEFEASLYRKGERVKFRKGNIVFDAEVLGVSRVGKLILHHAFTEEFSNNEIEWLD